MLNLEGLKVDSRAEVGEDSYVFTVSATGAPPNCCPQPLVRNGTKVVTYRDLPMHGRRVAIRVDRQRYLCRACGRTRYVEVPHMNETNMMTQRLVDYIITRSMETQFTALGRELGVDEGTVRRIFRRFAKVQLERLNIETPEVMGLDEIHILSKFRGVVTNVKERTLVDILPNRSKKAIIAYLSGIKDKERIKVVAMDMWTPYKDAVNLVLPHAKIVVDKFHVVRMANDAMERIRKSHRLSLPTKSRLQLKDDRWILLRNQEDLPAFKLMIMETWFDRFPDLKAGYEAKEAFRAVWTATTVDEAKARYDKWEEQLPDSCADAFIDLRIAMRNWREEIFAHFEARVTNAYTEAINGIARIVNRAGRGYSFEVLRAKMLLNYSNHKMVWGGGMAMATKPRMFRRSINEEPVPYVPTKAPTITLPIALGVPFWRLQRTEKMKLHQPRILDENWLSVF